MPRLTWLALGYNLPVNPSKNRVFVWRKLKELGAGYFKQGVALLPKSPQTMTRLRGLSAKIREMGGEATIAELRFCDPKDEQETISRFRHQMESEYFELLRDCAHLADTMRLNMLPVSDRPDRLKKMVRQVQNARSRDYFKVLTVTSVADSLGDLLEDMAQVDEEIGRQLKNVFQGQG